MSKRAPRVCTGGTLLLLLLLRLRLLLLLLILGDAELVVPRDPWRMIGQPLPADIAGHSRWPDHGHAAAVGVSVGASIGATAGPRLI